MEPIQRVLLARENSGSRDSFGKHQDIKKVESALYSHSGYSLSTHVQKPYAYAINVRHHLQRPHHYQKAQ